MNFFKKFKFRAGGNAALPRTLRKPVKSNEHCCVRVVFRFPAITTNEKQKQHTLLQLSFDERNKEEVASCG